MDADVEDRGVFREVWTDQLQRQVSDGLISTPQLLLELLHLLQESLNLNRRKPTSEPQFTKVGVLCFFPLNEEGNQLTWESEDWEESSGLRASLFSSSS